MSILTTRIAVALGTGALLTSGIGLGYWWGQAQQSHEAAPKASADREVLYWYDPMAPDQRFDKPGKSPLMDMPLVPRYADEVAAGSVRIDDSTQQNVGVRTELVEVGSLVANLQVPATVSWDLSRETIVSTPVNAIVSRLFVRAPFEPVRRGQSLAAVLAPEWSSALAEARALGQAQSGAARGLRNAAQQRLRVLGVPNTSAGRDGSVLLPSPQSGVVSEVLVREGQTVMAGTPMFRINGTDTLWLEAAIPQAGTGGLGSGSKVRATFDAVPDTTFDGTVETLLPQIDPATRTQRARIVLKNEGGKLVPGMFASVTLHAGATTAVPLVRSEALIATGTDSRVIIRDASGAFQPVRVRTGRSSGGRTEILAGLEGGERVVTSGQFLIDSEASLSGALQRLEPTATARTEEAPSMRQATEPAFEPMKRGPAASAQGRKPPLVSKQEPAPKPTERRVLYWYDPMEPDKHFDKPGKSPFMDMQLVPKYADGMPAGDIVKPGTHAHGEHAAAPQGGRP